MSSRERRIEDVAQRLWMSTTVAGASGDASAVVSDSLLKQLETGLRRWIGAEGYASLLTRSVSEVMPGHPVLTTIPALASVTTAGVVGDVPPSTVEQRDAVVALLVAMMRQLGGVVGDDMAVRLIEQSGNPSPRGVAGAEQTDFPR